METVFFLPAREGSEDYLIQKSSTIITAAQRMMSIWRRLKDE